MDNETDQQMEAATGAEKDAAKAGWLLKGSTCTGAAAQSGIGRAGFSGPDECGRTARESSHTGRHGDGAGGFRAVDRAAAVPDIRPFPQRAFPLAHLSGDVVAVAGEHARVARSGRAGRMMQVLAMVRDNALKAASIALLLCMPISTHADDYVLSAPEAVAEVTLPYDIRPKATGDTVTIHLEGWWCWQDTRWGSDTDFFHNVADSLTTSLLDKLMDAAKHLHTVQAMHQAAKYKDESLFALSIAEKDVKELKQKLSHLSWREAFERNRNTVIMQIPSPGQTNIEEERHCFTENELQQAWEKTRRWYFDEANRLVRYGK